MLLAHDSLHRKVFKTDPQKVSYYKEKIDTLKDNIYIYI